MKTINLSPALFWDVRKTEIDSLLNNSRDWVVMRVFEYGTVHEIIELIDYYGRDNVKGILRNSAGAKPVTRAMARLFFDLEIN